MFEFEPSVRTYAESRRPSELLRGNLDDALAQLERARESGRRDQVRLSNLEVAVQNWSRLLTDYERDRPQVLTG